MSRDAGRPLRRGRPLYVGTSWKMTKTRDEALAFLDQVLAAGVPGGVQAFVLPALTSLETLRRHLPASSELWLGAQNAHWEPEGAMTGEVSMRMVADCGATLVEIGHADRRRHFGETDETVSRKVAAALDHGLVPLVCVGESADTPAAAAPGVVSAQVEAGLSRLRPGEGSAVIVAYEPQAAIGADRAADPDHVARVVGAIRAARPDTAGLRVLYGGSVDRGNATALLRHGDVDGLFAGRSGWTADGFTGLLETAAAVMDLEVTCS